MTRTLPKRIAPPDGRGLNHADRLIAVYGTLRKGKGNAHRLEWAPFLGETWTSRPEGIALFNLGCFPAACRGFRLHRIRVEVYAVCPSRLLWIDRLEGHPLWYRREPVRLADGRFVDLYLMPQAAILQRGGTIIESGDWLVRTPEEHNETTV